MTWGRFDDGWGDSPSVTNLSLAARWHLFAMIQWCCRTKSYDGRVRAVDARRCSDVEDPTAALNEAVSAGHLMVEDGSAFYRLVAIEDHVPPPHMRDEHRKQGQRERQQRRRERLSLGERPESESTADAEVTRDITRDPGTGRDGELSVVSPDSSSSNDGSSSVGGSGGKTPRKRPAADSSDKGYRLPDDWWPDDTLKAWFAKNCPALTDSGRATLESEKFRDYWLGIAGVKGRKTSRGWAGAWRNWMRKANDDATNAEHQASWRGRSQDSRPSTTHTRATENAARVSAMFADQLQLPRSTA